MVRDVVIVGAGPVGNYTAERLAGSGFKVTVTEEHEEIGKPVHCTGILGDDVMESFNIDPACILKKIKSVRVLFPSGDVLSLPTPIQPNIVDRTLFDVHLGKRAHKAGAEFLTGTKVTELVQDRDGVTVYYKEGKREGKLRAKLAVLACGAMSSLPVMLGFSGENSYQSVQIEAEGEDMEGIQLFLGQDIAPGSFGYIAGCGERRLKIGLITRKNAKICFDNLMNRVGDGVNRIISSPLFRRMPLGIPHKTVTGRIMTVGDAAGQLKTTTGGGVFYGLRCGDILVKTLEDSYVNLDFNPKKLLQYDSLWKKEIGGELRAGLFLRSMLENVDDQWWNRLFLILKEKSCVRLIEGYKDFDHHYRFILEFFRLPTAGKCFFDLLKANIPGKWQVSGLFKPSVSGNYPKIQKILESV